MKDIENQAYDLVEEGCRNIINSGLIMSNNTISKFLRTISQNPLIAEKLKIAVEYTSYADEYEKSSNYLPTGNIFKLPEHPLRIVCLVTGILFEFDNKTISLNKFLSDFFSAKLISDSFIQFCNVVLSRYVIAFRDVIQDNYTLEDGKEVIEDETQYDMIDDVIKEQIIPTVKEMETVVMEDDNITDVDRKDLLFILDGFIYSLESFNSKIVTTIWVSLKKVTAQVKSLQSFVDVINDVLEKYAVIDEY